MLNSQALARRFLVSAVLVAFGAAGTLLVQSLRGDGDRPSQERRIVREMHPTLVDSSNGKALSLVLDEIIQPPAVIGYVRGVVTGEGKAVRLQSAVFTDFPVRVTGFFGPTNPGYVHGAEITLRVPGGQVGDVTQVVSDAPRAERGMTLYVIASGEGAFSYGGGDDLTRLVAVVPGQDVFEVRGGEVHGQGPRAAFHEPEDVFQRHFATS